MDIGYPPFLGYEVFELPEELRDEVLKKGFQTNEEWIGKWEGKPCYWWDPETKGCAHYENRPQLCRDFIVGCDSCFAFRRLYGVD
jgi:Fe-S-cluster containining protein